MRMIWGVFFPQTNRIQVRVEKVAIFRDGMLAIRIQTQ